MSNETHSLSHWFPLVWSCKRTITDLSFAGWPHGTHGEEWGFQLTPEDHLVSFDITSLFTQVPINEALRVVKEQLNKDWVREPASCQPTGRTHGTVPWNHVPPVSRQLLRADGQWAMGSPLSPVIANLFMKDLEQKPIQSVVLQPKLWVRYVDDTLIVWEGASAYLSWTPEPTEFQHLAHHWRGERGSASLSGHLVYPTSRQDVYLSVPEANKHWLLLPF